MRVCVCVWRAGVDVNKDMRTAHANTRKGPVPVLRHTDACLLITLYICADPYNLLQYFNNVKCFTILNYNTFSQYLFTMHY